MDNDLTMPLGKRCDNAPEVRYDSNFLIKNENISASTIVGTAIISDCDPCIKAASCVNVCIYSGRRLINETRTNRCGNFVFTGLNPGCYTVIGRRKGLICKYKEICIGDDSIYMLNLVMEREKRDC